MTSKTNLILALRQIENVSNLVRKNNYERFFMSHLVPLKYEIQRQIALQTNEQKKVL